MRLRMPFVGGSDPGDPFRVPMPTYNMVQFVPAPMSAIVTVPDEDSPDDVDAPRTTNRPIINGVPVVVGMSASQLSAWRVKLDARWGPLIDVSLVTVV